MFSGRNRKNIFFGGKDSYLTCECFGPAALVSVECRVFAGEPASPLSNMPLTCISRFVFLKENLTGCMLHMVEDIFNISALDEKREKPSLQRIICSASLTRLTGNG